MTKSINATILRNLIIERELCIARLQFVTLRLEKLEGQIAEQRWVVENEKVEGKPCES